MFVCRGMSDADKAAHQRMVKMFTNAAKRGHHRRVLKALQWRGTGGEWVDPRVNMNAALGEAAEQGHVDVVEALLAWRGPAGEWVDARTGENYAVGAAAECGYDDLVEVLLHWRGPCGEWVDPREHDDYAVKAAAQGGHADAVRVLLAWRKLVDVGPPCMVAVSIDAVRKALRSAARETGKCMDRLDEDAILAACKAEEDARGPPPRAPVILGSCSRRGTKRGLE